ncbi:uncharacterized protein G2W53_036715 [Senna tora]|uniref:Uncharacterized protein n=1 Tax=Senna tora TaxID=362788 RepID=A0A834SXX8_9FABA|nr:uncharacterized protein G2W53_036715 [Senna tora]
MAILVKTPIPTPAIKKPFKLLKPQIIF